MADYVALLERKDEPKDWVIIKRRIIPLLPGRRIKEIKFFIKEAGRYRVSTAISKRHAKKFLVEQLVDPVVAEYVVEHQPEVRRWISDSYEMEDGDTVTVKTPERLLEIGE